MPAELCDCAGCREFRAIHDGHCPELPWPERAAKRTRDRDALRRYDDAHPAPLTLPWAV